MLTSQNQDVGLSADSAPAAAGLGWALSGHGSVSAGRPAGPCCQIPVPGTQTQTGKKTQQLQLLHSPGE